MRAPQWMLAVVLALFVVTPKAVAAQCMRCMDYNHCEEVSGGNNTECEEYPCKYTGEECDGFASFIWEAKRIETRNPSGHLIQLVEVAPTRFAFWNCQKEVITVADQDQDGTFHFLDPSNFRLEITPAEDRSTKAVLLPLNES